MSSDRRLIRVTLSVAPVVFAAWAQAGIDVATTESGAIRLSGGWRQIESWGAERMLLTVNNKLDAHGLPYGTEPCGSVDASLGVTADNQRWLIGYITERHDGVHLTYDRLARLPVLQVLGRDDEEHPPLRSQRDVPPPAEVRDIAYPANSHPLRPTPGGRDEHHGTTTTVPEPASLVLLALGALAAARCRGRRPVASGKSAATTIT